jgi:HAE1 family hydrophobic/amphiphilic exporter-1
VGLTRFSLRNPIVVTLFYAIVAATGALAFARMGRSVLPPIAFPVVTVTAAYPGAGPEEIERLVVEPIEDQLAGIAQLDRVSSFAQDGQARIVVRFRFGSNLETGRSNVQQAVEAARADMPADLVPPVVEEFDPSQSPVLKAAISSPLLSPRDLADLVRNKIAPALRASSGVGTVLVTGEPVREFVAVPKSAAMQALGATPLDLARALAAANDVFPGGRLREVYRDESIAVRSTAQSAASLRDLPVPVPGSPTLRVGDVAGIVDGYADPTVATRVDGEPAIVVDVSPAENGDVLAAVAAAQRTLARLSVRYPLLRIETLSTRAPYTNAAVAGVLQTLSEGVVLTVLVMVLFLHAWRNAAIAAISIPASLSAAFVAMWIAGFTLNVLSLMGLSLTIGILVDDSIVIIEAIVRLARRGLSGEEAALAGRAELGGAAFAITLVDVAVFAPIAFMSGLVGAFMREFAMVVVFATAFSLLVSLTLVPLLAARWSVRASTARSILPWMLRTRWAQAVIAAWRRTIDAFASGEERLTEAYARRWLPAAMRRGRLVLSAAGLATIASLALFGSGAIGSEFSPPTDRGIATVDVRFPPGTPLEQTEARSAPIVRKLLDNDAVEHVVLSVGRGFNGAADVVAPNLASIDAILTDPSASGDAVTARIKAMQSLVPEAVLAGAGRGMGGTAPIRYGIAGDPAAQDAAARAIAAVLENDPNAADVRLSDAGIAQRLAIDVDPQKSMVLGVSADDAAQTARLATGGARVARLRMPGGLVDVVVRSDAARNGDFDAVLRASVRDRLGRLVPLADVTSVTHDAVPSIVERENGERIVSVTANAKPGVPIGKITAGLSRRLREPGFLAAGARIEPRGDVEQFLDAVGKMFAALGLALAVVYCILAVLYRSYALPLAIMTTVPLASIGAIGSLYVFGQPLNLYSMLGIVMLTGLVAKNGILLVEYAQREIRTGESPDVAMQRAAQRRLRPILMTTIAMIAGMLPLALGHTIGAEYRQAMGTVVIGGLSSSLLLTLFVVPIAFVSIAGRRNMRGIEPSTPREPDFTAKAAARVV